MFKLVRSSCARARRHGGRFAKFSAVGVVNVVTEFAVYASLISLSAAPALANIGGFFVANIQSYFLNARFTFRQRDGAPSVSLAGYGKFFLAHSLGLVISTAIVHFLAGSLGPWLAKLIAIAAAVFSNYAMSAIFVFRDPPSERQ